MADTFANRFGAAGTPFADRFYGQYPWLAQVLGGNVPPGASFPPAPSPQPPQAAQAPQGPTADPFAAPQGPTDPFTSRFGQWESTTTPSGRLQAWKPASPDQADEASSSSKQVPPPALASSTAVGPGALSGGGDIPTPEQASDPGRAMQGVGAWLMARDNPRALGILPSLSQSDISTSVVDNKLVSFDRNTGKLVGAQTIPGVAAKVDHYEPYTHFQGMDGQMYRMHKGNGEVSLVASAGAGNFPVTAGEKAADTNFAKTYTDWVGNGGYAKVEQDLTDLDKAKAILEANKDKPLGVTGAVMNSLPDTAQPFVNSEGIKAKEAVERAVQNGLTKILGAQFAAREGEAFLKRAYNPSLSEAENISRIDALKTKLLSMAKAQEDATAYFGKHGTLKGYSGKTAADLTSFDDASAATKPKGNPKLDDIKF
jgi:hypothetical protein